MAENDYTFKALPNIAPTKGDIRIVQDYMPEASKKISLIFEYDGENWILVDKVWSVVKAVEELYERLANEDLVCCQDRDAWEGGDDVIARAKRLVGELSEELGGGK